MLPRTEPNPLAENTKRRKSTERNRLALIDATLDSVAEIGISSSSVTEIIRRANLSRGMIHLHFGGKEQLLVAAARHAAATYFDNLDQMLSGAAGSPAKRIEAVVCSDLHENVLNRRSVNIWYALRGEARERAAIAGHSDTRDTRLTELLSAAFGEIVRAANPHEAQALTRDLTHGLLALLEGMWTDYLLHPDRFSRPVAQRIVFRFLSALLPEHFDLRGALSDPPH